MTQPSFAPNSNTRSIRRWMYGDSMQSFHETSAESILGSLLKESSGDVALNQRNAWIFQIHLLKNLKLDSTWIESGRIYFEVTIPRLGRRADVVLLLGPLLIILEFKVGETNFDRAAINQVWDYALDLKYFHESSHQIAVLPIVIATEAKDTPFALERSPHGDNVFLPVTASCQQLSAVVGQAISLVSGKCHRPA